MKKIVINKDIEKVKFARCPSPYYAGCTEVWSVYPGFKDQDEADFMKGLGYIMFCSVLDERGEEMFLDHGKTSEFEEPGPYHDYLRYQLNMLLAKLGVSRNIE